MDVIFWHYLYYTELGVLVGPFLPEKELAGIFESFSH